MRRVCLHALPDRIRLQSKALIYEVAANSDARTTFASIERVGKGVVFALRTSSRRTVPRTSVD